ncbi:MAG: S1 RNA-binding domain-containing protein [Bacteroidota bacterium]
MTDEKNTPRDDDFATLFAASERASRGAGKVRPPRVGDKVRAKILSIGRDTAFVELENRQGEGMLDVIELRDVKGQLIAAVGDTIDATVAEAKRRGGMVVLRRGLARGADGRPELAQAFQHAVPVEGTVTAVNKGGVEVDVAGVRAFCPISQLELRHVEDATPYLGQKLMFRIARYEEEDDRRGPNVVLSRRALLADEARALAVDTRAKLSVGAVLSGVVTGLKDYGAFIDLGGIEGMLHVSEIGFQRVARPSDVLAIGQRVSVQVLRIDKSTDPRRSEQVALSLKALETDPWETEVARFVEGTRVRGTVTRVTAFGAFIELAPGIEGLAHVSELGGGGGQAGRRGREAIKAGDALDVTVIAVDRERRRLSLSTTAPEEPLDAEARAVVDRSASPSKQGKLGTMADLFKNVAPGPKR